MSYCLRVAKLAGQSLFELGLNAQLQHCQNESGLWGWSLLFVQNQAMMQPSPNKPNSSREVETHQNHQSGMPIFFGVNLVCLLLLQFGLIDGCSLSLSLSARTHTQTNTHTRTQALPVITTNSTLLWKKSGCQRLVLASLVSSENLSTLQGNIQANGLRKALSPTQFCSIREDQQYNNRSRSCAR